MTGNENAADDLIEHRISLLRYEAGVTRRLLAAYDAALRDVDRQMVRLSARIAAGKSIDVAQRERLVALGTDLAIRVRELRRHLEADILARLNEVADAEQRAQAGILSRSFRTTFAAVPEGQVATLIYQPIGGYMWTERLAADLFAAQASIQDALARMVAQGASIPDIARAIKATGTIRETYRGRLVSIARTEVQRVANTVALATYEANADVLGAVQWLATLDSRTCLVCAPLHNKVYPLVGGVPRGLPQQPPLHPRCRCFLAPVSKPWAQVVAGVPTATPEVWTDRPAEDTTFEAWLRRQPADRQREFFDSDDRRDAWRSGALTLDKFSDNGRILALGELRARYPDAL